MSYSKDLRECAVKYRKGGHSVKDTSEVFGVGQTTIRKWVKRYEETGDLSDKELNRPAKKLPREGVAAYIAEHPDAYQREIGEAFGCSDVAVSKALKRYGFTRKKRHIITRNRPLNK